MTVDYTLSESVVIFGILAMALMAVGLIVFVLTYQKKFAQQQIIYQQILLKASLDSQERERERIARELHDGVGAMLATIKLLVHRLPADQDRPDILQDIKTMLAQTMVEVRTISKGLSPLVVKRTGWIEALHDYCNLLDKFGDIRITFVYEKIRKSNNFNFELSLYRIAQELIHNAMQHAHPTYIHVSATMQHNRLRLEIQNDGQPFSSDIMKQEGLGLLDVRSRLESLQGTLYQKIHSNPSTRLVVEVPLNSYTKTA